MRAATVALALAWSAMASTARAETPKVAPPNMETYQLVLLLRRADAPKLSDAELEKLQAAHIGHLKKMATAGKMVVAGPLDDQPDPAWRGICLYRVATLADARALAEQDPVVKAGRLRVEVMTWWTEKGAMTFPIAAAMTKSRTPSPTTPPPTTPQLPH